MSATYGLDYGKELTVYRNRKIKAEPTVMAFLQTHAQDQVVAEASFDSYDLDARQAVIAASGGFGLRTVHSRMTRKLGARLGLEKSDLNDARILSVMGDHHPTTKVTPRLSASPDRDKAKQRFIGLRHQGWPQDAEEVLWVHALPLAVAPTLVLKSGGYSIPDVVAALLAARECASMREFKRFVGFSGNGKGSVFRQHRVTRGASRKRTPLTPEALKVLLAGRDLGFKAIFRHVHGLDSASPIQ
jgi:hypothetical protein